MCQAEQRQQREYLASQQQQQQQQQQAHAQGAHMAVGQPQMAEFDHPQQRHTNECNVPMNQSQVPGSNAQPQHAMMGGVQS
jgi:hypothetical protein